VSLATPSHLPLFLAFTLPEEGGYSNDPGDPGGPTNLGMTIGTLSDYNAAHGLAAPTIATVKALTLAKVQPIYSELFDQVVGSELMPVGVGLMAFDFAVNAGPVRSVEEIQEAVGTDEDGGFGPLTLAALQKMDPTTLIARLAAAHIAFYQSLSTFGQFGSDWVARVGRCQANALVLQAGTGGAIPTTTPTAGPSKPAPPLLIAGSTGSLVSRMQTALQKAGFYLGYRVDGDFAAGTLAAVEAYQRTKGLLADGEAGGITLAALGLLTVETH